MKFILSNYRRKSKNKIPDKAVPAHRLRATSKIMVIIFVLLVSRLWWIQFVQGAELKELASRQQTLNKIISPKRGCIYDTNGKVLAISAEVDTITINPAKFVIQKSKDIDEETAKYKTLALQEKVAQGLSEVFELDYNTVLSKVQSTNKTEVIIKQVEKVLVDKLKDWMDESEITEGINIDKDNKRYYPYGKLASHLIGFTGTDNTGLYGIEYRWNTELKGNYGKIVTTGNMQGSEISDNAEQYIDAQNGANLYLTMDVNVQNIVEKYLAEGVEEHGATAGSAILMDPQTGEIISIATYPNYDLNTPFTINNAEDQEHWEEYSREDRNSKLQNMWTDRNTSKTYEPGSTFKLIVSAAALEEEITDTDVSNDFHCEGYTMIGDDTKIGCAQYAVHGNQSLRDALRNSCNAAFIQLGQKIGKNTLYKYFDAFGLFERTGAGVSSEGSSRFHELDKVGPVELATTSFGQRFEITPLQLATAVCAIANGGNLIQPRIVKQIENTDTGIVTDTEINVVRKVISEETSKELRDMMKSVVENRENVYGTVAGYTIGGKTGTSEPPENKPEEGYVVSYVAIAPADEPKVVGLVVVYNPSTENPYGSRIAAPIMSKILTEALPYIGIASGESDKININTNNAKTNKLTNVTNKTLTEAKRTLENLGYKVICSDTNNANSILVTEQIPAADTAVMQGAVVALYTEENNVRTSVEVPALKGKTLVEAKTALADKDLNISYSGTGKVVSQDIEAGTTVEKGTIIKINLE